MNQDQTKVEPKQEKQGLLTENTIHLNSQLWNMENTVLFIEKLVNNLRSPELVNKKDDCVDEECIVKESNSVFEKYVRINNRLEMINNRLSNIGQNLAEII